MNIYPIPWRPVFTTYNYSTPSHYYHYFSIADLSQSSLFSDTPDVWYKSSYLSKWKYSISLQIMSTFSLFIWDMAVFLTRERHYAKTALSETLFPGQLQHNYLPIFSSDSPFSSDWDIKKANAVRANPLLNLPPRRTVRTWFLSRDWTKLWGTRNAYEKLGLRGQRHSRKYGCQAIDVSSNLVTGGFCEKYTWNAILYQRGVRFAGVCWINKDGSACRDCCWRDLVWVRWSICFW